MLQSTLLAALVLSTNGAPAPPSLADDAQKGTEVTVQCHSGSTVRVRITDEKIKLQTKYGTLDVNTADITRIEFASRTPAALTAKIDGEVRNLSNPEFETRELATKNLKKIGDRAAPLLTKALKSDDPETGKRASEVLQFLRTKYTEQELLVREFDVVHTGNSKFEGRIAVEYLNIESEDFDKTDRMFLHRMVTMRSAAARAEPVTMAVQAPGNMSAFSQQFGKEFTYSVTGLAPAPGVNANVWGTDQYTLDSNLAAAVVHANLAKSGETVVVRVRIVQSPLQFVSSFRNGVTSVAYGVYPAGAYEFVK